MTDPKLTEIINEAIMLDRSMSDDKKHLDKLKEQIRAEAERRGIEHEPTPLGGTTWTRQTDEGAVRVTFPVPPLKSKVGDDDVRAAKRISGRSFRALFKPVWSFKPFGDFRRNALELLGARKFQQLIKLLTNDPTPSVSFETKSK